MLSLAVAIAFSNSQVDPGFQPGLTMKVYDIRTPLDRLYKMIPGQTPNAFQVLSKLDIAEGEFPNGLGGNLTSYFIVEISATFTAKEAGEYEFRLTSDDGSSLTIGNKQLILSDKVQAATPMETKVQLAQGKHDLLVRYFENEGQEMLRLEWRKAGGEWQIVDGSVCQTPKGVTPVISPGQKQIDIPGGPRRPGKGMPLTKLNPAYSIRTIHPKGNSPKVGAMDLMPGKGIVLATFEPHNDGVFDLSVRDGKLWLVSNYEQPNPELVKFAVIADNLKDPLGLKVMGNTIVVTQQTELTRLSDKNNDGFYETHETISQAWKSTNYHHFTFGLLEKDGTFYGSLSTTIGKGIGANGPNPPNRGTVFSVAPEGTTTFISGGHRTPNGLFWGPEGALFVGENQGAWQPANRINHVRPGAFFGHYNDTVTKDADFPNGGEPSLHAEQPLSLPALWIPQNEAGNSPAGAVTLNSGEFKGQSLICDVRYGGLHRGFWEKVDGEWQGGMTHFSQGFEAGTNRIVADSKGNLYVGMIGATDTWAWVDPLTGKWTQSGLQVLTPTGKSTFEIHRVSATPRGFRVVFNRAVKANELADKKRFMVESWAYAPVPDYGGPKVAEKTHEIAALIPSADHRSVEVVVNDLEERRCVRVVADVTSIQGTPVLCAEAWYTLNAIPGRTDKGLRVLAFSRTTGYRHDSIETAVATLKNIGQSRGWIVEASEDADIFKAGMKNRYDVIAFLNTTGDILTKQQEGYFEEFMLSGGGFLGLHAAADTEYDWPFYQKTVGAAFASHPAVQPATVICEDRTHRATDFLPPTMTRTDEWYDYKVNPRPGVRVLASLAANSYQGHKMGADHPIMWCHSVGKGRAFYTGFGHTKESFAEPKVREIIAQGIIWASAKRG